jgi:general secretion pathway protein K
MRASTPPRGAALLLVMVSIAVVTALAVDLAYQTRVSLQLAADARDELRATALAKSAVNVSRLVLHFQQQLDGATGALGQALAPALQAAQGAGGQQPGAAAGGGAQAAAALAGGFGGIRLWELVPVNSAVVPMLLGGASAGEPAASEAAPPEGGGAQALAARAFGDFEGAFSATIEDEERKINVRQLAALGAMSRAQALRIAELVRDPKYDFLFDRDDANGLRVSRAELLTALTDWVDEDEVSTTFTGDVAKPLQPGHGDENAFYDRLEDRYEAKNASFDSLDELYQVAGVSDAFMAAFGDQLTVFPDLNAPINVNATSPEELLVNALAMSNPPGVPQAPLLDPAFAEKLGALLAVVKPLPFLSITPQQFAQALQLLGVVVAPEHLQAGSPNAAFTNRSSTFRIRATGQAGGVTKQLQAVVVFDRRAGALAQDLGRLVHWNEE